MTNFLNIMFVLSISAAVTPTWASNVCGEDPCASFIWPGNSVCIDRYELSFIKGEIPERFGNLSKISSVQMKRKWIDQASTCMYQNKSYGMFSNEAFLSMDLTSQIDFVIDTSNEIDSITHPGISAKAQPTKQYISSNVASRYTLAIQESVSALNLLEQTLATIDGQTNLILDSQIGEQTKNAVYQNMCSVETKTKLESLNQECPENSEFCNLRLIYGFITDCIDVSDLTSIFTKIEKFSTDLRSSQNKVSEGKTTLIESQRLLADLAADSEAPPISSSCGELRLNGITTPLSFGASDFANGSFGMKTRYLRGEWSFGEFGVTTSVPKSRYHILSVAQHVRSCFFDDTYGRMSSSYLVSMPHETNAQFSERVLSISIELARELIEEKRNIDYLYLARFGVSSELDIQFLTSNFEMTQNDFNFFVLREDILGWMVYIFKVYDSSINLYLSNLTSVVEILRDYRNNNIPIDYTTLLLFLDDTILEELKLFFSEEVHASVVESLTNARNLSSEELSYDLAIQLELLLLELESHIYSTFNESSFYQTTAFKIIALFGCPESPEDTGILSDIFTSTTGKQTLSSQCYGSTD